MASNGMNITRADIKFWMPLLLAILAGAVAFTRLQSQVDAMTNREQANKTQFMIIVDKVGKIHETVIRLDENQSLLMKSFNLTPIE